ncbi:zf-HC2 domain-containing protein [Actinokineospora iranica]|uniref:Predicted anti-sigma-YlaC factor YlaD, contains Zn-finger domain n=1 Tax=Actinokineospora iranica TaxID=1271860 RepID=A0A1G6MBI4_9PSEU|nr:zf-HC2 domain-containing protein [Actinokineospora iranica]SDC52869.1 Predicted anti-sigma-YlaC factor YlaD, contains Zn-finger domain [Actinokineospora iranica]
MTCREALSARLDGEPEPVPADITDAHLAGCPVCRAWQTRAQDLSRALRVREAPVVPDLTAAILATGPIPAPRRGALPRVLLALVAIGQLALALTQIVGVGHAEHGGPLANHLANEGIAWNAALGVGLGYAAWRPRAAGALIPAIGGFVVLLLGYVGYDLIVGSVPVSRELKHSLVVLGLVLLVIVHRRVARDHPGGGDVLGRPGHSAATAGVDEHRADSSEQPRGRHLRPAGRHRAA